MIDDHAVVEDVDPFLSETAEEFSHISDAAPCEPETRYDGKKDWQADGDKIPEVRPDLDRPRMNQVPD